MSELNIEGRKPTSRPERLRLSNIFWTVVWLTCAFGTVSLVGEAVNSAALLPEPWNVSLATDAFKVLFGTLLGLLDPTIGKNNGNAQV